MSEKISIKKTVNSVKVNQKTNKVILQGKGARGLRGYSFLSGNGIPAQNLGNDGDTYVNNSNGDTYKKIDGIWVAEGNLPVAISAISFSYEKQTPASEWNITHNLGFKPAVSVMDYGTNNVECDIEHINENQLKLNFMQAGIPVLISGYAYLS